MTKTAECFPRANFKLFQKHYFPMNCKPHKTIKHAIYTWNPNCHKCASAAGTSIATIHTMKLFFPPAFNRVTVSSPWLVFLPYAHFNWLFYFISNNIKLNGTTFPTPWTNISRVSATFIAGKVIETGVGVLMAKRPTKRRKARNHSTINISFLTFPGHVQSLWERIC